MKTQDNLLRRKPKFITCNKETGEATITPICERISNIYENEDAPRKIGYKIEGKGEYDVVYELSTPFEERIPFGIGKAIAGEEIYVNMPDFTDVYGTFLLFITLKKNGKNVICQPLPFSHIRTADSAFKKCGAQVHMFFADPQKNIDAFKVIKKCGVRKLRDESRWDWCEKEKGKIEVMPIIKENVAEYCGDGSELIIILDYGNPFYDEGKAPYTEEGLAAFCNYCRVVAETFKGTVKKYEVWNEYNLTMGHAPGYPKQYAWMLKEVYKTVKAVDPEAEITAGVTCGTQPEWLRQILEEGAYDYFDKFSIHPYCAITDSASADEIHGQTEANVQSCIDVIKEYGEAKPVWISEMGWTAAADENYVDRKEQAAYVARLFAITEAGSVIDELTYYDFINDGVDKFHLESHWGFVESWNAIVPCAAKESYAAVSCLNYMIAGGEFADKSVTDNIKHIAYSNNTNIFWSLDGNKKVTFRVDGDVEIYDMYGNKMSAKVNNGMLVLELDGDIVYINGANVRVEKVEKPDKIIYDFPYTLSAVPVKKQDGWYLKGIVKCHTDSLKGRLRIEMPEFEIGSNYARFDIKAGEKFEVEIKVGEEIDLKKRFRALVDLNLEDGFRDVKTELVSFLQLPYGKTDDILFSLDSNEHYFRIGGVECPELKADISLSYDEEKLYLYANVFDKNHLQEGLTAERWMDIWDGDGIEIIIQPLYDGNSNITRFNHIGLALTSNIHESVAWKWRTVSNRAMGRLKNCDFKAERKGDITSYRAEFNWKDLLPPNVELKDCDSFGFCLRVDYAESNNRSIDGYTQIYGGMGNWRAMYTFQPSEFGRFIL